MLTLNASTHNYNSSSSKGAPNMYSKSLIESTYIEIMNAKGKNMSKGCIYKQLKQETHDFMENYILPLMGLLSREKNFSHG